MSTTCGSTLFQLHRLSAVACLSDDFDVLFRIQDHPEAVTHRRLLVADKGTEQRLGRTVRTAVG
jgi:hypothetical protein